MPHKDKRRAAFCQQRKTSRQRGIDFQFTWEEWLVWWEEQLGPDWLSKRGCKIGKFVMARKGDVGPYHPSNVVCITTSKNVHDGNIAPTAVAGDQMAKRSLARHTCRRTLSIETERE